METMNEFGATWNKFQEEIKELPCCGACGQFYEISEQAEDGYHSANYCEAYEEEDN